MSEKHPRVEHKGESKPEHIEVHVQHKEKLSTKEKHEAHNEQKSAEHYARSKAEKLALKSSEHASKKEGITESEDNEVVLNKSYKSVMTRVESQLPTYQRVFSKIIRNPSVDKTSAIVGKTIARPSAIAGSAMLAFFGLALFGYVAKNIGFELPDSLFVLLVIAGWFVGLLLEAIYKSFRGVFVRVRARG